MSNESPYSPPYPKPRKKTPSLPERFMLSRKSWLSVFFNKSYTMKMGQFKVLSKNFFVVNQPNLARTVLVDEADKYPKSQVLYQMLTLLLGNGIFISNGEKWKTQRKMMEQALSVSHIRKVFPLMQQAVEGLSQRFEQHAGVGQVNISEEMAHVTADIIFRTIFSKPLSAAESRLIFTEFSLYQRAVSKFSPFLFVGIPARWIQRFMASHARAIRQVIADNVRPRFDAYHAGQVDHHEDILAAMLMATDDQTNAHFSFEALIDQIAVLFLAGHETSATTLSWAFYILANCPHVQRQIVEEVQTVLTESGSTQVAYSDIKKLKHISDVFKETLRLYPPVGSFMRDATTHECMRNKQIKPKDVLMVIPWLMHRREDVWPNAHEFQPERFRCPEQKDAIRQYYYPYSAGPRVCIGASFANQESILILATLVQRYQFATIASEPEPLPVGHLVIKPDRNIHLQVSRRKV